MPDATTSPGRDRSGTAPTGVTLAALTFRRPGDLAGLLPALAAQAQAAPAAYDGRDRHRRQRPRRQRSGGRDLVRRDLCRPGALRARGGAEHRRGAEPRARRRRGTRLLVFIDDDERPSPDWLRLLLATFERERLGRRRGTRRERVRRRAGPWMRAGAFFVRRRLPTGTRVDVAATNNLLLDLDVVRRPRPPLRPGLRAHRRRGHALHPSAAPARRARSSGATRRS